MAEPFVFSFSPDAHGCPQIMYISDLSCVCGLCGHPQIQRFYHATGLHTLTLAVVRRLAHTLDLKAGYECENCGSAVGPEGVVATALRYAFADDTGEIVAIRAPLTEPVRYQLRPQRRLDPQVTPTFEIEEAIEARAALDEGIIEAVLSRPVSVKQVWRDMAHDWTQGDEQEGFAEQIAPDLWGAIDATPDDLHALFDEIDPEHHLMRVLLSESQPTQLPECCGPPASLCSPWRHWMPEPMVEAIDEGRAVAGALVDIEAMAPIVERAMEVARLQWQRHDTEDGDILIDQVVTPRGWDATMASVALGQIALRAVYTGLTPGESARLTGEEIVGALLGVWRPARGNAPT